MSAEPANDGSARVDDNTRMSQSDARRPFNWAHRGASGYEIDNTVEAFDLAFEQGADGVESDVRMSRDGGLFLFHDDFLRVNSRHSRPEDLSMAELRTIDLGQGRRIPEVGAILKRYREVHTRAGMPAQLSLDVLPPQVGVALAELVGKLGMSSRVVITPSDVDPGYLDAVRKMRQVNPAVRIVRTHDPSVPGRFVRALPGRGGPLDFDRMHLLGVEGVNVGARHITEALVERIRQHGLSAYVWDCHEETVMRRIVSLGVDAIYSNYPDRLGEVIGNPR